jgi:hypothetical protein
VKHSVCEVALLFSVLDEFVLSVLNGALGKINLNVRADSLKEMVSFIEKSISEFGEFCDVIQQRE